MKCHLPKAISNCPSFSPQWIKCFFSKTLPSTDNGCYYIFIHHLTFCSLVGRNSYKSLFTDALSESWGGDPSTLSWTEKENGPHLGKRAAPVWAGPPSTVQGGRYALLRTIHVILILPTRSTSRYWEEGAKKHQFVPKKEWEFFLRKGWFPHPLETKVGRSFFKKERGQVISWTFMWSSVSKLWCDQHTLLWNTAPGNEG